MALLQEQEIRPIAREELRESILVVDDSRAQRRLLASHLSRWGYAVIEASGGEEALEICRTECPDLIVSDWMMPGMSGLEFCRRYREIQRDGYGYFILLTSKSTKDEVAEGLDVGADDFLTKPFNAGELRARIRAGERIVRMQRELTEKNRLVSATLAEKQALYDAIDRDLVEARKLQQSLVRDRFIRFGGADVSLMLQPAGRVGGDLVGAFQANPHQLGIYSLDVSGHGIASALLTARLAAHLSGTTPRQNIALTNDWVGGTAMRSPAEVVAALNCLMLEEFETEHYFTILLARVDLETGSVCLCQAGHPYPVIQRAGGAVETHGQGGLPVGLIPDAEFTEITVQLHPGDRIFLGSDGITECENPGGEQLGDDGFARILRRHADLPGPRLLEALMWDLSNFADGADFTDDVSGLVLEFSGLSAPA